MTVATLNTTSSRTASSNLKVKHISVAALHKTTELLGGTPGRTTGGHNYLVYRFGNGKQVHLPPLKGNGTGMIGRGDLHSILKKMLEAGIPMIVLEQALDENGATWRAPPRKHQGIRDALNSRPELAENAKWDELEALWHADNPASDAPAEEAPVAESQAVTEKRVNLWAAITYDLPQPRDNSIVQSVLRSIKASFGAGEEPYHSLIADGHVTAELKGDAFKYLLDAHATKVVSDISKPMYEEQHAQSKLPKPPHAQKWSGLSLQEVTLLDLPQDAAEHYGFTIRDELAENLHRKRKQPYSRLMKETHVLHLTSPQRGAPGQYLITEHAASVLAREARAAYERLRAAEPGPITQVESDLVEIPLREVILNSLPKPISDNRVISSITRSFSRKYTHQHEPFKDLIANGDISRRGDGITGYSYSFTERGMDVVSAAALAEYATSAPAVTPKAPSLLNPAFQKSDRPDYTERTLGSIVKALLPNDVKPSVITQLASQAGIGINHKSSPYAELLEQGHVHRYREPGEDRYKYQVTPTGEQRIAQIARATYDKRYAPARTTTTAPKEPTPVKTPTQPAAPAPLSPAQSDTTPMPADTPTAGTTPPAAPQPQAVPQRAAQPSVQTRSLSDAINSLTRKLNIQPQFTGDDGNLDLDWRAFIKSIDAAISSNE